MFKFSFLITLTFTSLLLAGCSYNPYRPEVKQERKHFIYSVRRFKAPPVYNRLLTVRSPEPIPREKLPLNPPPLVLPTIRLTASDDTLESVAAALGKAMSYSYFCAPSISENRITLEVIGDIDTLGRLLAKEAGIKVIVDHNQRFIELLRN